jgi:hypothetical protein
MPVLDTNIAIATNAIPTVRFMDHLPTFRACIAHTNDGGRASGIANLERHV